MAKSNTYKSGKNTQQGPAGYKGINLAYLDAEYLSARFKRGSIEDVISVGMVITNPAHEELDRFYSTIELTRGHKLTPLITELTGLTAADLAGAPTYEEVMTALINLVRRWQVGKICVWGGDKSSFIRDFDGRTVERTLGREILKFINTFENIQKEVSLDITGGLDTGLSLADMKTICGLGGHVEHNALSDAEDMLDCIRIIENGAMVYDGVKAAEYKKFRGDYVRNRSFDKEEDEAYRIASNHGAAFLNEIRGLGFDRDPKTKAFMDDLEFLLGQGNAYMGTFAEMMAEKTKEE